MWKFVTRGIRETLERRACRTNVYSQTSPDNNATNEVKTSLTCNHKFLAPNFSACNNGFCGSTKAGGAKDKDYDSKWNTKYTWTDAVGWSSVLAVGWVVCQTLCLRRRFFENEKRESLTSKLSQFNEPRIRYLFGQVLNLQPKQCLPIINCVGNNNKNYIQEDVETDWTPNKAFGPITVEEALKEATDDFAKIHNSIVGEFELRFGIKALEEKRYKDAIHHFTTGAKLSSPASMFNLGLCYELGLGTLADQAQAAKYYTDAAEQGHADAIYNLGVFHAQGRGGFSVNIDRARSCFVKAAKLGQAQAQHALDLENQYHIKETNDNLVFPDSRGNSISLINNKSINSIFVKLGAYKASLSRQLREDSSLESSGRKLSLEDTKNPTEIFLDLLGLKESSHVIVSSNGRRVPC